MDTREDGEKERQRLMRKAQISVGESRRERRGPADVPSAKDQEEA